MAQELSVQEKQTIAAMYAVVSVIMDEPNGAPSGIIYMGVMNRMDHHTYMRLIGLLKEKGWVTESNHVLTWTGPRK